MATVAADILTFDDFTAVSGVVYLYSVQAFNTCGDGLVSAQTPGGAITILVPPSNVTATDNLCDRVTVTWMDNNLAPQEAGFSILRNGVTIGMVA
ncbi:MAG: hypothetical protein IPP40_15320 [bacterium]|nr:hypothetical protein [bacterium]